MANSDSSLILPLQDFVVDNTRMSKQQHRKEAEVELLENIFAEEQKKPDKGEKKPATTLVKKKPIMPPDPKQPKINSQMQATSKPAEVKKKQVEDQEIKPTKVQAEKKIKQVLHLESEPHVSKKGVIQEEVIQSSSEEEGEINEEGEEFEQPEKHTGGKEEEEEPEEEGEFEEEEAEESEAKTFALGELDDMLETINGTTPSPSHSKKKKKAKDQYFKEPPPPPIFPDEEGFEEQNEEEEEQEKQHHKKKKSHSKRSNRSDHDEHRKKSHKRKKDEKAIDVDEGEDTSTSHYVDKTTSEDQNDARRKKKKTPGITEVRAFVEGNLRLMCDRKSTSLKKNGTTKFVPVEGWNSRIHEGVENFIMWWHMVEPVSKKLPKPYKDVGEVQLNTKFLQESKSFIDFARIFYDVVGQFPEVDYPHHSKNGADKGPPEM